MIKNLLIDDSASFYADHFFSDNVRIDRGVHCTANIKIGSYVHISPYVVILGGSDSYFIADGFNNIMTGAKIICASDIFNGLGLHGSLIPEKLKGDIINKPVIMERYSNIGTGAIVMPGSILREGVLLTAGSMLIGDTEAWGIYKGNPAVLVRKIDGSEIIKKADEI